MTRLRITSAELEFTRHENQFFPGVIEGEWDSQAVWYPWIERQADQYWMWYCGSATTYDEGLTPMVGMAKLGGGLR